MAQSTRKKQNSGPPIGGLLLLGVVMAGAVVLARMAAQDQKQEKVVEPEVQASDIFGNLPEETPAGPNPASETNKSPEDIAETACWVEAQAVAVRAAAVYKVAKEAKARDDHAVWAERGKEAKELYDQAVILSVEWERGLIEKYGDGDRRVRAITAELNGWFKILEVLAKTTGR